MAKRKNSEKKKDRKKSRKMTQLVDSFLGMHEAPEYPALPEGFRIEPGPPPQPPPESRRIRCLDPEPVFEDRLLVLTAELLARAGRKAAKRHLKRIALHSETRENLLYWAKEDPDLVAEARSRLESLRRARRGASPGGEG
ncbi:MAG: hypothetical protein RML12_06090 [Xanthomonadales bacterium]|nr:hypothetical protein [Xanthomonadales bacterium]